MSYSHLDDEERLGERASLTSSDLGSSANDSEYGFSEPEGERFCANLCPGTRAGRLVLAGGLFLIISLAVLLLIVGVMLAKDNERLDESNSSGSGSLHPGDPAAQWAAAITADALLAHLNSLLTIAMSNGGNRACGQPGYAASVEYVRQQLKENNYDPVIQNFTLDVWDAGSTPPRFNQTRPTALHFDLDSDFAIMTYSGPSAPTGNCGPVFRATGAGCTASNFVGMNAGDVAFVSRSPPSLPAAQRCSFEDKVNLAVAQGATGVVIYNDGEDGHTGLMAGTLGSPQHIPVFFVPYELGIELAGQGTDAEVCLYSDSKTDTQTTWNVCADTLTGDAAADLPRVVVGSHLDSVPAGPGINDNGSGSSNTLEMAIQLKKTGLYKDLVNQVRFCFWGAEELGLKGSRAYVSNLVDNDPEELKKIACNLNFDMEGSPNFMRQIMQGSLSPDDVRKGSSYIEKMFSDYCTEQSEPFVYKEFSGRSDYQSFVDAGIPAGGLESGAEEVKTVEERDMFGGIAHASADTCYHQSCDTVKNIDMDGLLSMAHGAATVTMRMALDKDLMSNLYDTPPSRKRTVQKRDQW
eukprot:CAMPEP_0174243860 /NCGR_PEP_ID=MMETSP0417-20130205/33109_1 /TAXON_ID=242541 /ORGANISM="Mayorella sp, Strain BSH-02190019" /LENGTH=578 /DNA_ID=CAMNT_0015323455 /DNA_START=9 /DNA_END=1745 /DNA_ORIENTATION=+